jgi:hypothetical protein
VFRRRQKSSHEKRPAEVTIIAVAMLGLFIARLYRVISPLVEQDVFRTGLGGPLFANGALTPLGWDMASSAFYLLLVVALALTLIGFLRLRRWSWLVLMVWTGFSLAYALWQYFLGQPNYLVMASDTVIAFALSQRDVQLVFGIRSAGQEPF